eukprot:CAMPEP_0177630130 /NCGR_PEP_ID=MMETSP0447-20121125/1045_1 /TAXON_ID=0 /ORGANISM="Stygamoeba regulata, Strain BSH-02190019" /LENGTH=214 /DNA_ID=CAMNT_0019131513 /DNA_START=8 /DNA_END=652 /DNA_ORIENTATION=+
MASHGHSHSHGGGGGSHGHDCSKETVDSFETESLFGCIDVERVRCLNEEDEGSVKDIFKPHERRLDKTKFVQSDVDEQLIIYIPFTGSVKVASIVIVGDGDTCPKNVDIWVDRNDIDFDSAEDIKPAQRLELQPDPRAELEYHLSPLKFSSVSSITLFVSENFGDDQTRIYHIGLRGQFLKVRRELGELVYELAPNPKDHKVEGSSYGATQNIF